MVQIGSRRRKRSEGNGSTIILVLQVALSLLCLCVLVYMVLLSRNTTFFLHGNNYQSYKQAQDASKTDLHYISESGAKHSHVADENKGNKQKNTVPLDDFIGDILGEAKKEKGSISDAWEIAELLTPSETEDNQTSSTFAFDHKKFQSLAASIRQEFANRYGGEVKSRAMLSRGLSCFHEESDFAFESFKPSSSGNSTKYDDDNVADDMIHHSLIPADILHTANRLITSIIEKRPFKVSFGGYSVTVGRGNYFNQSYPFVMEKILLEPMKSLGIELKVRNAAIGGIPSFPYGWCLDNFLGNDADVVSWDYSMNESGGATPGIEAYLRQIVNMPKGPMFIVKDTHMANKRKELLAEYVRKGILKDPLIIHTDPAAEPYLKEEETKRPTGFQDWRVFGAPKGAPGQVRHHPSLKEHELIGWMLSIHFLAALEVVDHTLYNQRSINKHKIVTHDPRSVILPKPVSLNKFDFPGSSALYGTPVGSSEGWKINKVSCRTSFDPVVEGALKSIIVGNTAKELDVMLPKSEMIYSEGWVLDIGSGEKKAKRKLQPYGGLGYIDMKKAYYGLPMSNDLSLWLPWEGRSRNSLEVDNILNTERGLAKNWYKSIILCEVNEKRGDEECNMEENLTITIGSAKAEGAKFLDTTGTMYLGKKICLEVPIPNEAKLSKRPKKYKVTGDDDSSQVGLSVNIKVEGFVILRNGPCSISHVVWENLDNI